MINKPHTVLRTLFWGLTLMTVFAVQVVPYSFLHCDMECSELIEFEEPESEEKDKKEKKSEKKRSFEEGDVAVDIHGLLFLSCFHFLNGFPVPHYLETHSPPPDVI